MPLRVERCSANTRDFDGERKAAQRHSTLDETGQGRVLTAQG